MRKKLLTIAFTVAFLSTAGCGIKSEDSKSKTEELSNDPVKAFEKIVATISRKAKTPVRYIWKSRFTGGSEKGRDFFTKTEYHFGKVAYDIQKTDSLVSPYKATVDVGNDVREFVDPTGSVRNDRTSFLDLSTCKSANRYESGRENPRKAEYLWQDNKWVLTGGRNAKSWPIGEEKYYKTSNGSYMEY